jgi:hypothetical protein
MKTCRYSCRPLFTFTVAASLAALPALADTTVDRAPASTAAYTAPPVGPSVNNDAFKKLRTQCEKEVPLGKADGDVCVEAAAILVSADLPDEFREVKEDQRIKIALRLLERGVDNSNLARARAYDYYNRFGFLGLSAYADAYRANELMVMMTESGYTGGTLRKIRSQTLIISFGATEAEKRAGCTEAKKWIATGKLDVDSKAIAQDIVGSTICTGYDQVPK